MILFLSYVVLIFDTLFVTCVNNVSSGNLVVIFEMFIVLLLLWMKKGNKNENITETSFFERCFFSMCALLV